MSNRTRVPVRQPNQVILSGPQAQVDQLLQLVRGYRNMSLATFQGAQGAFKIALVQHGTTSAQDETNALNETLLKTAHDAGLTEIRTEPNYTVVAPPAWRGGPFNWEGNPFNWEGNPFNWEGNPFNWEGNPFNWEGNPFNWEGNPFNWEGNPFNWEGNPNPETIPVGPKVTPAGATVAEAISLFTQQDAFARIQVTANGQRKPDLEAFKGEGVLVGLFDSCPSAEALAALPGGAPAWLHPHPAAAAFSGGTYVDHGLFNASLIHFVAPSAEIHLYQVMTGEMYGETIWLITALANFLNMAEGRPTVTNLSLGLATAGLVRMPAIEALLAELVRRGGVVCAAAGNGARRAQKPAAVPQAQMPASLPYVIAVAASNQQNARSTFSQCGDIAAPGGDTVGGGADGFDDIIGMGTVSPTGYVRMDCGTSFATPLVAGAVALTAAALVQSGAVQDANFFRQVFGRLGASALQPAAAGLNTIGLGAGILQVVAPN